MLNNDNLKKFPAIIGQILRESGDEKGWLINEILVQLSKNSLNPDFLKNKEIQNISEYCIEKIIEKQSSCFYKDLRLPLIKDILIRDFQKMEHERRRDDFDNFCLCTYQQIENITNSMLDDKLKSKIEENRKKKAYKYEKNSETIEQMLTNSKRLSDQEIDDILSSKKGWSFSTKFRAVLYYCYFAEDVYHPNDLLPIFKVGNQLYQVRNKNHRGSLPTDYQKKTLDEIYQNHGIYYLRFLGFLEDFVVKVNKSIVPI